MLTHSLKFKFLRIIKNYIVQGGDFLNNDGTGETSIYNETCFDNENFTVPHDGPGVLSMSNATKPNTNGCQFFITCAPCPNLDGKYVAFGQLKPECLYILKMIESVKEISTKPVLKIVITECGEM